MIHFTSSQVGEVLQRLHDSEINLMLSTFWNDGFDFDFGSLLNNSGNANFRATFNFLNQEKPTKIETAISIFAQSAVKRFPNSEFSKWYNTLAYPSDYVLAKNREGFLEYGSGMSHLEPMKDPFK